MPQVRGHEWATPAFVSGPPAVSDQVISVPGN
jgi:hypothetical protein